MPSIGYIIIGVLGGALIAFVIFMVLKKKEVSGDSESMLLIQDQISRLTQTVDEKLGSSQTEMQKAVREQFRESQALIQDITEKLTRVDEGQKQVINVADQLKSLQDVLKNPKQRGVLGEYYLESVMKNVLPPKSFQMQYKFEDGEIVDAAIFLDAGKILPVDSKFSLENYNRIVNENDPTEREKLERLFKEDLKRRIDETSKYIRPKENTMDFAFMFIPSEAIYYDLLVNQVGAVKTSTRDLIEYAFNQKKVIIVSPTSFLAYLQTVLQGLRALEIEESAKEIRKRVEELGRHLANYDQFMGALGKSLGTTVNHYNKAHKELGKVDKDVLRITEVSPGISPEHIGKPDLED